MEKIVMTDNTPKKEVLVSSIANAVLVRPRITEKAYAVNVLDQYVFQVAAKATKKEVKRAVEEAYGVHVLSVNMVRLPGKKRRYGKFIGKKSMTKKAIVKVKKGETIALFKAGI